MRTPVKGQPDFSTISDENLRGYIDLSQQMIFAYKYCDEEKVRVLTAVWKQMSDEYSDRVCKAPFKPVVEETTDAVVHKIKMVKPLKRIKR